MSLFRISARQLIRWMIQDMPPGPIVGGSKEQEHFFRRRHVAQRIIQRRMTRKGTAPKGWTEWRLIHFLSRVTPTVEDRQEVARRKRQSIPTHNTGPQAELNL